MPNLTNIIQASGEKLVSRDIKFDDGHIIKEYIISENELDKIVLSAIKEAFKSCEVEKKIENREVIKSGNWDLAIGYNTAIDERSKKEKEFLEN